jgi:peptide/nickel transport system permease protein
MAPLLVGISIIMFALIQSAPGGPEAMFLESGRFINPKIIETYRHRLGLDQPVPIQYLKWLGAALTGDFGYSYSGVRPVGEMIAERLPATLELMLTSFIFAALIAIPLGIFSAVRQYSLPDYIGTAFSFLGIAMPVFWFGLILQLIFSVKLGWLPTSGRETVGDSSFFDQVKHLILPGIVLALLYIAGWSRYMRSSLLSILRKEYMLTARSKGMKERDIIWIHGVKNALIPVVSVMALDLAGLFSGAVITETVFAWPGIGRLFIQATFSRDYPLMMGILMMGSFMVVFFNLIADLVYAWLDPRIVYT